MKKLNKQRRNFLKSSSYFISSLLFSLLFKVSNSLAKTKLKPRIIIVGFGIGGATCVSFLLKFSKNLSGDDYINFFRCNMGIVFF